MSLSEPERKLIEVELRIEQRTAERHLHRVSDIDTDITEMEFRKEREQAYYEGCQVTIRKLEAILAGD